MLSGARFVASLGLLALAGSAVPQAQSAPVLGRDALLAYETSFVELAHQTGGVIEVGVYGAGSMKGAIGAIEWGGLGGDELAVHSAAWLRALQHIERSLAELGVPRGLEDAHRAFAEALGHYTSIAEVLGSLGRQSPSRSIEDVLDEAVRYGTEGDQRFDEAAVVIQHRRRQLGLPPSMHLPDPDGPPLDGVDVLELDEYLRQRGG